MRTENAMSPIDSGDQAAATVAIPRRPLGRTGCEVTQFALGGEGVLRTHGRVRDAVAVIHRALELGVNYCDTAPAYAGSLDYYGAALRDRREQVFLASKTHDRTRDGSLRLLDQSLNRLRTDRLDLWQLHDLRSIHDLEMIFSRGGALEALLEARAQGRVRFLGITGHHDPAILLEAMRRFDFDTVLVALNAADVHRLSFAQTVLVEASRRGMGVIGMKVYAAGALVSGSMSRFSTGEAMGYVLSLPGVSTVVIGCSSPAEVDENAQIARAFRPFDTLALRDLEGRAQPRSAHYTGYKKPA
jgi:aryl-alcohol dehydrogenase-like predicted oxidoreductase